MYMDSKIFSLNLFKSVTNISLKDLVIQGDYFLAKKVNLFASCFGKILYPAG